MTKMMPALAQNMNMTQDQLNEMLGQQFPGVANGMGQVDTMGKDFNGVITVMDQNVTNYEKANKLPMRMLPWILLVFGAALVVLSGLQLMGTKKAVAKV